MGDNNSELSWFARGYWQKVITWCIFVVLSVILAYGIEQFCYNHIFAGVDAALVNRLSATEIPAVKTQIYDQTKDFGVVLLLPLLLAMLVMLFLIKASTWLNITKSVVLDKAVRFGDAMERVGILNQSQQESFIRSHNLNLYIAEQPLPSAEAENVEAKPYVFAYNLLSSKGYLDAQAGRRRLCVEAAALQKAADALYASLKPDADPSDDAETVKALQRKVMELEAERRTTNRQLVENASEITDLKNQNTRLANATKGEELREGKKRRSEQELALYAMVFAPAYRRLSEGKHDPKDFTRAAFERFFAHELRATDRLHEQLKRVTGREIFNKLPSNVFDAIWNNLKDFDLVNAGGAAPSGSLERLERQFYPNDRL